MIKHATYHKYLAATHTHTHLVMHGLEFSVIGICVMFKIHLTLLFKILYTPYSSILMI